MALFAAAAVAVLRLGFVAAPYAAGATTATGKTWQCSWKQDWSARAVHGLGLADAVPTTQTAVGPHESAEACERWCCDATHLSKGPDVQGGWEASLSSTGPGCDGWQFDTVAGKGNGGCWVSIAGGNGGRPLQIEPPLSAPDPTAPGAWMGATGCTRPKPAGATFVVVFCLLAAVYLAGGVIVGRRTGRPSSGGRLGALSAHPHAQHWEELQGLCRDGLRLVQGWRSGQGRPAYTVLDDESATTGSKPKKGKRSKREKGSSKPREQNALAATAELAPPPPEQVITAPRPAAAAGLAGKNDTAQETVAGDGGRWVRLPS
jgi:hypothetical protein